MSPLRAPSRLRLEAKRASRGVVAVAVVLVAAAVSVGMILSNLDYQWPWDSYYTFRAEFSEVKGVVPGTQQVRLAGVAIGQIKAVSLVHGMPVLTMAIDSRYGPVYRNARLQLRPATPLQDMYVEIESRGTPGAGALSGNQVLSGGQTVTPVDISTVMNTFNAPTRQYLGTLLDGLGQGLADRGAALQAAFVQMVPFLHAAQRLSGVLSERRLLVEHLVHTFAGLTGALAQRDNQLSGFVRYGDASLSTLAASAPELNAAIDQLPPTVSAVESAFNTLRGTETVIDPALVSLRPVAANLSRGLAALRSFALEAQPALASLQTPVTHLRTLASALQPAAANLAGAAHGLEPQAPQVDTLTSDLLPCLNKLSGFFANTDSVMKFSDAGGVIPRAESIFGLDSVSSLTGTSALSGVHREPSCTDGGRTQ